MTQEYVVKWLESHEATVEANSEEEAAEIALEIEGFVTYVQAFDFKVEEA